MTVQNYNFILTSSIIEQYFFQNTIQLVDMQISKASFQTRQNQG